MTFDLAHMWFSETVHEANTNEDIFDPAATIRVSEYLWPQTDSIINTNV